MNRKVSRRMPFQSRNNSALVKAGFASLCIGAMSISPMLGFTAESTSTGVERSVVASESQAKLKVGDKAPLFTLKDLSGEEHSLEEYIAQGNTVVLEWFSPMCPFVKKHYRDDTMTMVNIENDMNGDPVVWLRINSAKASHPSAKVDLNKSTAEKWGITTPILMDPSGQVGKSYGAKRTPEMYIIDSSGVLAYHGAIDNRPDAAAPGDVNFVSNALNQILKGEEVSNAENKAYGCSVKY